MIPADESATDVRLVMAIFVIFFVATKILIVAQSFCLDVILGNFTTVLRVIAYQTKFPIKYYNPKVYNAFSFDYII